MFTANDIHDLKDKERTAAENYFRNLMDFVKWTTTITLAAVVWISTAINSLGGCSHTLAILSLLALSMSLLFAVFSIKRILDGSSNEWDMSRSTHSLVLLDLFEKSGAGEGFIMKRRKEAKELSEKSLEQHDKYYGTSYFNVLVTWHLILLCIGVVLYAASQLLNAG